MVKNVSGKLQRVGDEFLVIATDGLYDMLSDDEIGSLMSSYLTPTTKPLEDKRFQLKDTTNAASHLIRNALNKDGNMAGLLAIPPPYCRKFRDDMTVNVLFFDKGKVMGKCEVKDIGDVEKEGVANGNRLISLVKGGQSKL